MSLARFRANPRKVRVSIRKEGTDWRVTIRVEEGRVELSVLDPRPKRGVMAALRLVKRFEGVDLGMEWAYEHPWGADT